VRKLAAVLDPRERANLEDEVEEELADAFAFAEASPFPGPGDLMTDTFKETPDALTAAQG
jgi:TPP-dependent pyruvate/acetoin dehydrogenase alpha subunit